MNIPELSLSEEEEIEEIEEFESKSTIAPLKKKSNTKRKKTVYDNYLTPESICDKLQNILHSKESMNLNHFPLSCYLEQVVFNEPMAIEKLKAENPLFLHIYLTEIEDNNRRFKRFTNKYDSFALSWLMCLYK